MQVGPIKPTLKVPGTKCSKLKCDEPLSKFAFKFNLRRYTEVSGTGVKASRCTLQLLDTRISVLRAPDFSAEI